MLALFFSWPDLPFYQGWGLGAANGGRLLRHAKTRPVSTPAGQRSAPKAREPSRSVILPEPGDDPPKGRALPRLGCGRGASHFTWWAQWTAEQILVTEIPGSSIAAELFAHALAARIAAAGGLVDLSEESVPVYAYDFKAEIKELLPGFKVTGGG